MSHSPELPPPKEYLRDETWAPWPRSDDLAAPEGGGGDYGCDSGGYDQLGFGTLMYAK
ncbi:hypothetical protein ABT189_37495 [Streptomyces sp900105755]|uniref:hypothetical protein n=1 Tax=Streptomyces sp. 900105755 TaxID=3154389 RepID=UPI00331BE58D